MPRHSFESLVVHDDGDDPMCLNCGRFITRPHSPYVIPNSMCWDCLIAVNKLSEPATGIEPVRSLHTPDRVPDARGE